MQAPDKIIAEIEKIVLYLWNDEIRDFADSSRPDHIYHALVKVRDWLEQTTKGKNMEKFTDTYTPADERKKITNHAGLLELLNIDLHSMISELGDKKTIELITNLTKKEK